MIDSFESAEKFFAKRSEASGPRHMWTVRLPDHATLLVKINDDQYAIRLHQTDIVGYHRNGSIRLDTSGYFTATTFSRMNKYLPAWIRVRRNRGSAFADVHGEPHEFIHRAAITASGAVSLPASDIAALKKHS